MPLLALDGSYLPDPPPDNLAAAAPAVSIMLITRREGDPLDSPSTELLPLLLTAGTCLLLNPLPPALVMDWMAETRRRFQNGDYGITTELRPAQAAANTRARDAGIGRIVAEYAGPEGDRLQIVQSLPAELMPVLMLPEEARQPVRPYR